MFYNMSLLEKVLFLKRNGGGSSVHEETSYTGSFVTNMAAPLRKLLLTLEPIQSGSGTPSPDNVRPISGHTECVTEVCGKNLFDVDDFISGVDCGSDYFTGGRNAVTFDKQGTYTIKANTPSAGYLYARIKNADGTFGAFQPIIQSTTYTTRTLTVTDGQTLLLFDAISNTLATTKSNVSGWSVQVEVGTTATDYEPYNSSTYTTTLGRTVYGGTLDVVSGELVVDRAMVDLGGLTWQSAWGGFATRSITNAVYPLESIAMNILSDRYPTVSYVNRADKTIYGADPNGQGNANFVAVQDSTYASVAEFKTAMNGVMLCYELATPQTYQLDPQQISTFIGQNNLISDGNITEVVYLVKDE